MSIREESTVGSDNKKRAGLLTGRVGGARPQYSDGQFYQLHMDEMDNVTSGYGSGVGDSFPEAFVDELSRREVFNKHLFRPNTYLHKWWARRCGTTFRSILKQFVPDPKRRDYYAPGGLEGKVVLDPMIGGGTILHEAIRLGAHTIGADIDPIPIVQARATLTETSLYELRTAFRDFFSDLYVGVGHYFETECPTCEETVDASYTLHGIRKTCDCGDVVQIDRFALRHEENRSIWICPDSWEITEEKCVHITDGRTGRLISKAEKKCEVCCQNYEEMLDLPFFARYIPVAIVASCDKHGLFIRSPSRFDLARIEQADELRDGLSFGPLEDFAITDGPKSGDLLKRHIHSYLDLFSSRQLLYMHHAILALGRYEDANKVNLGMLVSAALEFNSLLCGYKGWYKRRPGAIRHVFALHAYSFQYTALENNPINRRRSSGNLQLLFRDRIERGRKWAALPVERRIGENGKSELVEIAGELDSGVEVRSQFDVESEEGNNTFQLIHGDSQNLPIESHSVDLVVTDPPYYDNVQYSDLSNFFRVWLKRLLPDEAEWQYDTTRSAVATKSATTDHTFVKMLSGIFYECGRVLKPRTGRMVFTFHHWDPNAWADLTIALKNAGFELEEASVVHSEHPISVHIRNLNSIKHDSILVFKLQSGLPLPTWQPMDSISTDDSETLCRHCAATLGWLLEREYSAEEIRAIWVDRIGRRA